MKRILDALNFFEDSVPEITGRLDRSRIAVAGHSMGGHTAGMLLGAQFTDEDGTKVDLAAPRIKAGVLLAPQAVAARTSAQRLSSGTPFSGSPVLPR